MPYEGDLTVTDTDGEARGSGCMIEVAIACYGDSCPCTDGNGQIFYIEVPCGGGDGGGGNPTDPDPGGYDPHDDGPGGGGGSEDPETPCEQLESRSSDATFKVKMNELKNNRNGDREKGFLMFNDTPKYSPTITGDEYGNINYGTQDVEDPAGLGGAHNHLSGAQFKHIALFTPEDLCVFATIANYTQEPIENLTYYLASPEGFYAIKIQDVGNLLNFAVNYLSDNEYRTQVLEAYDRKKIIHGKPKADQEKGFLEIIHKFHIYLDVYECDANYNNWKKLTLDTSGAVVRTPC